MLWYFTPHLSVLLLISLQTNEFWEVTFCHEVCSQAAHVSSSLYLYALHAASHSSPRASPQDTQPHVGCHNQGSSFTDLFTLPALQRPLHSSVAAPCDLHTHKLQLSCSWTSPSNVPVSTKYLHRDITEQEQSKCSIISYLLHFAPQIRALHYSHSASAMAELCLMWSYKCHCCLRLLMKVRG